MDKFFIMNAFKTLDEIEAEKKNKKSLEECMTKSLKEAYDLDELQDKYVGQGCTVETKDDYSDEHATIKGLKDFKGDFENSIWELALDIGVIINVEGKDIKLDLEEKLPKDLAKAYKNTKDRNPRTNSFVGFTSRPQDIDRYAAQKVDYENAQYTEISKEEAKKEYSKPNERSKLRVIINGEVIRWDNNNTLITNPQKKKNDVNYWSFKNVIDNADKIYVTDEADNLYAYETDLSDDPYEENKDVVTKVLSKIPYWRRGSADPDEERAYDAANSIVDYHREITQNNVFDTGNHSHSPKWDAKRSYEYLSIKTVKSRIRELKELLRRIPEEDRRSEYYKNELASYQADLDRYFERYCNEVTATRRRKNNAKLQALSINVNLCLAILYKYYVKQLKDDFNKRYKGDVDDDSLKYHRYKELETKLSEKQNRIQELQKQIADLTAQISQIQGEMTPELKEDYEDKLYDKTVALGNEWEDYTNKLNKLLHKEEKTTESLEESLEDYVRIYTKDKNNKEDFIDPINYTDLDSMIEYAKGVFNDGGYAQVCLVNVSHPEGPHNNEKIDILWDSDDDKDKDLDEDIKDKRSIGEIVDAKLKNESLNESKKFNIRDDEAVKNAKVYKEVGKQTNDDLVVVDSSLESLDEEAAPHIGDSILQCKTCKTSIFKNSNDLVQDTENENLYNKDDACPHCGAKMGYVLIGQVADKKSEDAQEVQEDSSSDIIIDEDNKDEESGLEPVENDFVDLDEVDDIKEESFNKLVNPYLTKLYENVNEFKTTDVKQLGRNKLIIEGIITGKNNKQINTQFLFTIKENKAGSIVFEGYNKLLTEQKDSFQLKSRCESGSLLFESLGYKYNKDNQLIEGLEQNK